MFKFFRVKHPAERGFAQTFCVAQVGLFIIGGMILTCFSLLVGLINHGGCIPTIASIAFLVVTCSSESNLLDLDPDFPVKPHTSVSTLL